LIIFSSNEVSSYLYIANLETYFAKGEINYLENENQNGPKRIINSREGLNTWLLNAHKCFRLNAGEACFQVL
jgi:hypothetical protein